MTEFQEPNARECFSYRIFTWYFRKKMYFPFVKKLGLQGNEEVLEFGSGMGVAARLVADILKEKGGVITCMDVSKNWMKKLRKYTDHYSNVKSILGELKDNRLADNYYDVIYFIFVLHDIPKDERKNILKGLVSSLKWEGKLVLREPYNKSHGIPIEEVETYMKEMGMKNVWSEKAKILRVKCYTAEYVKSQRTYA